MAKKRNFLTDLKMYEEQFYADLDRERKQLERELKLARKTNDYAAEADILYNLAFDFYDLPEALEAMQTALDAAQKSNDASLQVEVGLGLIDLLKEDWSEIGDFQHEQVIQIITPLLEVSETLETPVIHQHLLLELARSYYDLENYVQARAMLEQILNAPSEHPEYLPTEVQALALLRDTWIELEDAAQTKAAHHRLKQSQASLLARVNSRSSLF